MTTSKTPQDFFNMAANFYKSFPKTPAEAKVAMKKVHTILETEYDNSQEVFTTYAKATKGDATPKEIAAANKKAVELVKATTFASMLAVPGAIFVLPAIIEKAKEYSIDLVPASVSEHFDI